MNLRIIPRAGAIMSISLGVALITSILAGYIQMQIMAEESRVDVLRSLTGPAIGRMVIYARTGCTTLESYGRRQQTPCRPTMRDREAMVQEWYAKDRTAATSAISMFNKMFLLWILLASDVLAICIVIALQRRDHNQWNKRVALAHSTAQ